MHSLPIMNFRAIHGYTNQYGETMKDNCIFRGAALHMLKAEDIAYMEDELGIRYILDYRDEQEACQAEDAAFIKAKYERIGALQVEHADKAGFDFGAIVQNGLTEEMFVFVLEYLKEGYRKMAFDNPAYHRLFELLLRDDGRVYFHCSAGKDRTGVAGFLIMLALGMSEDDAVREYLLSNKYLEKTNEKFCEQMKIPKDMREKCAPLLFVQEEFIRYTINAIKEKYQNYDEFLESEYGLDVKKRARLREIYCEKR